MSSKRGEIAAIAESSAAPTFDDTIVALEDAGRTLDDVNVIYGVWSSTMSGPDFQAVEREMEPRLAAFDDEITQNAKLFAPIEAVYTSPDKRSSCPNSSASPGATTPVSCAPARSSMPLRRSACPRSTNAWRRCSRASARTSSPTRKATRPSSSRRPTSPRVWRTPCVRLATATASESARLPARLAAKKLPGGWGIMMDDLFAAAWSVVTLLGARKIGWLG